MKIMFKIKIAVVACASLAVIGAFRSAAGAQEPSRSVWDGVYTEEQAKRGAELYGRECAVCHGTDLTGADEVPALAGPAFLANWDGLTVGDLSERVRRSMPPNRPGQLSRQQVTDILCHVLSVNGFPAGKTELEPKIELMKQIRIEATKPKSNSESTHQMDMK
jgi:S-disulfanyl-L-cysteine oxidoreductase SoxD